VLSPHQAVEALVRRHRAAGQGHVRRRIRVIELENLRGEKGRRRSGRPIEAEDDGAIQGSFFAHFDVRTSRHAVVLKLRSIAPAIVPVAMYDEVGENATVAHLFTCFT
jgi:hypothetical protein